MRGKKLLTVKKQGKGESFVKMIASGVGGRIAIFLFCN